MDSWGEFLADGQAAGHGVEIYTRDEELVDSVASYLVAGFAVDAPGVVVATPAHAAAISAELERRGLSHEAMLLFADAEETLDSLYEEGALSAAAFERVVGGLLDEAQAVTNGAPRAFGEMVDILCERRAVDDAIALEEMWEELRRRRPFSLLCGYRLDVFDAHTQKAPLPEICNVHSHVLPAHDLERFNEAVGRALTEVLGPATTRDIFYIVNRPLRARRVPVAQDALRWLAASFPTTADDVLAAARGYYEPVEAA